MRRAVLILLVLLLPLRGMAAELMQLAPATSHDQAMQQMADHGHGCCEDEDANGGGGASCADHDCCAAFLAPAAVRDTADSTFAFPAPKVQRFFAGFVADPLDPPPLAL